MQVIVTTETDQVRAAQLRTVLAVLLTPRDDDASEDGGDAPEMELAAA